MGSVFVRISKWVLLNLSRLIETKTARTNIGLGPISFGPITSYDDNKILGFDQNK